MDIYVYTRDFQYVGVVDRFESFIWTERYSEAGDFEIYTPVTHELINMLKEERFLVIEESSRFMVIEGVEIITDAEDGDIIKVTGRSAESLLDRRVIWNERDYSNYSLQSIVKQLLIDNAIDPANSDRMIPGLIFNESLDPAITNLVVEETSYFGENLYDAIKALCDSFSIGFKIELDDQNDKYVFSLYAGKDRSYDQEENSYVVFSKKYGNLLSSDYVRTTSNIKNTALVLGEPGFWLDDGMTEYDYNGGQGVSIGNTYGSSDYHGGQMVDLGGSSSDYYAQVKTETGDGSVWLDRREIFVDGTDISRTVNEEDLGTSTERTGNEGESGARLPVTAWSVNGIAPQGLSEGDFVQTNGGLWKISNEDDPDAHFNPDSGYWSVKVDNTTKIDNPDPSGDPGGSIMAWSVNGQAPSGLSVGTYVQTNGGLYKIVSANTPDATYNKASGYWSVKIDDSTKEDNPQPNRLMKKGALRSGNEDEYLVVNAVNGQAPAGLDVGTHVKTNGGTFEIIGTSEQDIRHNEDSGYWSSKMSSDFSPSPTDTVVDAIGGQAPSGLDVGTYVRTGGGYFKIIGTDEQDIRYNPSSGYYSNKLDSTPQPITSSDTGTKSTKARVMDGEEYSKILQQKGEEELSQYSKSVEESFNAEVVTLHTFTYGKDYSLGDVLQVINEYDISAKVRVSEYIRSITTSGINYYPTFITV